MEITILNEATLVSLLLGGNKNVHTIYTTWVTVELSVSTGVLIAKLG